MENTKKLEKRFYFFVPYNLSPIQQAIQAGHAALEYARKFKDDAEFIDYADNWKTWVILNGGTTNSRKESVDPDDRIKFLGIKDIPQGTLDKLLRELFLFSTYNKHIKLNFSYFMEPDLNDALTAVCFVADERVFNYEKYPDIADYSKDFMDNIEWLKLFKNGPVTHDYVQLQIPAIYDTWVESLGGLKNVFLRSLTRGKKLA